MKDLRFNFPGRKQHAGDDQRRKRADELSQNEKWHIDGPDSRERVGQRPGDTLGCARR